MCLENVSYYNSVIYFSEFLAHYREDYKTLAYFCCTFWFSNNDGTENLFCTGLCSGSFENIV